MKKVYKCQYCGINESCQITIFGNDNPEPTVCIFGGNADWKSVVEGSDVQKK